MHQQHHRSTPEQVQSRDGFEEEEEEEMPGLEEVEEELSGQVHWPHKLQRAAR